MRSGDAALLRSLRLAALRDAPDQFGESLTDAAGRSETEWAAFAASMAAPSEQAAYIAEIAGAAVGIVFAFHDAANAEVGRLGGMWVSPSVRGRGVGAALVEAVLAWSRTASKRAVQLWVVPGGASGRLYRRCGFLPTGASKPFPGDDLRSVIALQLDLAALGTP